MTTSASKFPFVYLVELFNIHSFSLEEADVCATIPLALQRVYDHLHRYCDTTYSDVSHDDDGILEGIAVFTETGEMLACVAVYHLDRDTGEVSPQLEKACADSSSPSFAETLSSLFNNK